MSSYLAWEAFNNHYGFLEGRWWGGSAQDMPSYIMQS